MAYELVRDFVYDLGQTYSGAAVETTFEFSTPAGPIAGPIADGIISNLQQECLSNGEGREILRTKVYADYSPILNTNFMVTFSMYDPTQQSPVGPATIAFIQWLVPYIVALVIAILIYLSIRTIRDIAYSPSGPALASGFKWLAIGLAILAGGFVISQVVSAIPKRQTAAKQT
jgi:hypothetical protein